ncbi:MAG: hypothetical protein JW928_06010 [Candidatus Aureabacteria bacterium]|nr:hypothetical protein [Candidatus Auribacterota bacterium]
MAVLLIIGIVSFLFAMALFFFPHQLRSLNELGNRILFTDERAIIYRKMAGFVLLVLSMLFFAIGYIISLG